MSVQVSLSLCYNVPLGSQNRSGGFLTGKIPDECVCLRVCASVCAQACVRERVHVCALAHVCVCVCAQDCVRARVHVCARAHVCVCVRACARACVCPQALILSSFLQRICTGYKGFNYKILCFVDRASIYSLANKSK